MEVGPWHDFFNSVYVCAPSITLLKDAAYSHSKVMKYKNCLKLPLVSIKQYCKKLDIKFTLVLKIRFQFIVS